MADSCAFCLIIAGQAPAVVVREWVDTIAILPREEDGKRGCTEGHILVIPRVHVADFTVDPAVSAVTALRLAELAQELRSQTGLAYNEITSAGEDATQTVWHLHRHLVPRRPDDGLALPWTGQHDGTRAQLDALRADLAAETDRLWRRPNAMAQSGTIAGRLRKVLERHGGEPRG